MAGCSKDAQYVPSTISISEDASQYIEIGVDEISRSSGVFTFSNCSSSVLIYSDRNILEKYINDEWQGVVAFNNRAMTEPSYELAPNESVEYDTDWPKIDEGEYRFIVPFSLKSQSEPDSNKIWYEAVYFTIK